MNLENSLKEHGAPIELMAVTSNQVHPEAPHPVRMIRLTSGPRARKKPTPMRSHKSEPHARTHSIRH
jgi:hypothetical protein